jgi:hypothetical protein
MEIEIVKNRWGSLFAVYGAVGLFQFEYRTKEHGGPAWYFWPRGDYDPEIFKGRKSDFPMDYFKDLCRSRVFTAGFVKGLSEDVSIIKGENFVKWR